MKKSLVSEPGVEVEHAQRRLAVVGAEHTQAAEQHCHLAGAQSQLARAVDEQVFRR